MYPYPMYAYPQQPSYPHPYCQYTNTPLYYFNHVPRYHQQCYAQPMQTDSRNDGGNRDSGPNPFVVNIEQATELNNTYRTVLWTGNHFQLTVMSINAGDDIGLEVHPTTDQFIRIEEGQGVVQMGDSKENLDFVRNVYEDYAIVIPAGKWHNLKNTGNKPLKVYVIYAPPEHPHGTVHKTKKDAMASS
ncbi:cupin domain-containing protein [Paenibacillus lentus]|uniref:Cupin domain-containing protein n=2 Tax=Paenibacillus lentus TaxID=1338368 RepID=A0A3Q8SEY7_9BACL|nr:cupin domain-containing protein [Paenibacillus lentus]